LFSELGRNKEINFFINFLKLKVELQQHRNLNSHEILEALYIEYTYDSNRIEGNTLTLRETDLIIHKGLTIVGKSMSEHLEAVNHYEAINFIRDLVTSNEPFNKYNLLALHSLILHGLDREGVGRFREVPVMISGCRHIPPQPWQVDKLMEDYFLFYQQNSAELHPIILAAEWKNNSVLPIKTKTHQRPAQSIFRYGLDCIRSELFNTFSQSKKLRKKLISLLRPSSENKGFYSEQST
jgi:hypothetical protein